MKEADKVSFEKTLVKGYPSTGVWVGVGDSFHKKVHS